MPKLAADVATTEDDQVLGDRGEVHDARVREVRTVLQAGHGWYPGTHPGRDEHPVGSQVSFSDPHLPGGKEPRFSLDERAQIAPRLARPDAESTRRPGDVRDSGPVDQELARNTADVQARAAPWLSIHEGNAEPCLHGEAGHDGARLAGTEHDRIEVGSRVHDWKPTSLRESSGRNRDANRCRGEVSAR